MAVHTFYRAVLLIVAASAMSVPFEFSTTASAEPLSPIPTTTASVEDACRTVDALLEARKYSEALDLINRIRTGVPTPTASSTPVGGEAGGACESRRLYALTRLATPTPIPPGTVSTAPSPCDLAAEFIADGEADKALQLITDVRTGAGKDSTECERQRLDALMTQARGPQTTAGDVQRGWEKTLDWVLSPLAASGLWILAALLIAVRLLSNVPLFEKVRSAEAAAWVGIGAIASAVLAIVLGLVFRVSHLPDLIFILAIILLSLLWLGAVVLAAIYFASRLRVSIKVMSNDDDTAKPPVVSEARTSELVATLREMAGTPPRGLETPRGTDVSILSESTLLPAPVNKAAVLLLGVVRIVFGFIPWSVTMTFVDDNNASVIITRNGRSVASMRLSTHGVPLPPNSGDDPRSYLTVLAAAFVVATLSTKHDGFKDGLGDASDPRGIGLFYLATTRFAHDPERATVLLSEAVRRDPGNRLADVALQHRLHRTATSSSELSAYGVWLNAYAAELANQNSGKLPTRIPLERRVLLTYFTVLINQSYTDTPDPRPPKLDARLARMNELIKIPTSEEQALDLTTKREFDAIQLVLTSQLPAPATATAGTP